MSLAVSYTTHTVEITASGLAVAAIGNTVEVSCVNRSIQVSPMAFQVSVAQAGTQGPAGPGVPVGGTTGQVLKKLSNANLDTGWGDVGTGDMLKSVYDTDNDGKVNAAASADSVPWSGVTGKPSTYAPSTHKTSHASGGTDALSPADIGAATAGHDHSGVYAPATHSHNDLYYTETEINALFNTSTGHDHNGTNSKKITWTNIDSKPSTYAPSSHDNTAHLATYITAAGVTYENLSANGDVGTGSSQVAAGNHNHDSAYASITHTHASLGSLQLTSQAYYDEEVNVTGTTFDLSAGNRQKKTMTANITASITPPSGPASGFIRLIGDASITYTIAWPSSNPKCVWLSTGITSITNGKTAVIAWMYDGTNLWLSCPGLVTTP